MPRYTSCSQIPASKTLSQIGTSCKVRHAPYRHLRKVQTTFLVKHQHLVKLIGRTTTKYGWKNFWHQGYQGLANLKVQNQSSPITAGNVTQDLQGFNTLFLESTTLDLYSSYYCTGFRICRIWMFMLEAISACQPFPPEGPRYLTSDHFSHRNGSGKHQTLWSLLEPFWAWPCLCRELHTCGHHFQTLVKKLNI